MSQTVIVSDIHLGSPVCQAGQFLKFLQNLPLEVSRLIINGDLFDSIDFKRLCKKQWKILSELRKLSKELELIWLVGNHDLGAESVAHLIGAKLANEWDNGDTLVLHGDIFDTFITAHPILTRIADFAYLWLQRVNLGLAQRVKNRSKTYLRCEAQVRFRALEYRERLGFKNVICGHTHVANNGLIDYFNTGCWTEQRCHYITISESGEVKLHEYT